MGPTPPKRPWLGLLVFVIICFVAAGLGGMVTAPNIPSWYAGLTKPSWNPPNWVFGPVWSALYLGMAVASWLVWRRGGWAGAARLLTVFCVQLVLNVLWSCLFFGLHRPGLAFGEVLVLWAMISGTLVFFWRRSVTAGVLFGPYLAWVTFRQRAELRRLAAERIEYLHVSLLRQSHVSTDDRSEPRGELTYHRSWTWDIRGRCNLHSAMLVKIGGS